jgi:uncharacterized FlaG/YvyC family protein
MFVGPISSFSPGAPSARSTVEARRAAIRPIEATDATSSVEEGARTVARRREAARSVRQAAEDLGGHLRLTRLKVEIGAGGHDFIVTVLDRETNEVIRRIPPQEVFEALQGYAPGRLVSSIA